MLIKHKPLLISAITAFGMLTFLPNANAFTTDDIFAYTRIGHVIPSPDNKNLAFSTFQMKGNPNDKRWQFALHVKNDTQDKIINVDNPISNVIWSNDNKYVGYISKGSHYESIWVANADGTENHKLVELNKDIDAFAWSPDSHFIALIASDSSKSQKLQPLGMIDVNNDFHNTKLYVTPFADGLALKPKAITPNTISVSQLGETPPFSWSPDSSSIAFSYQPKPGAAYALQNKLAIINVGLKTGKTIPFSKEHNSIQPIYSHNGQWIAFQSSPANTFPTNANDKKLYQARQNLIDNICLLNTASLDVSCLSKTDNEMPMLVGWTKDDSGVIVADFHKTDGMRFYLLSTQPDAAPQLIGNIDGYIAPLSINMNTTSTTIGFTLETPDHAPEAYTINTTSFKSQPMTQINRKTSKTFGQMQVIHWPSKDGKNIEGLLITPNNYDASKKYPLLVDAHGGPAGDWTKRYLGGCEEYDTLFVTTSCYAAALNNGFIIFQPNPRGSNGYGSNFRLAPVGDIGGIDYQDVATGIDYLIQKNIADADHLAMNGWSYGGYMTAWSLGHTNRFKAAVEADGNTDLISFSGTSDIPDFTTEYLGAPLWENSRLYAERSPIIYTQNINTPLLIISGGKDMRVPITQGQELYTALKYQHKVVKMLILPDQGHVPEDANLIYQSIIAINTWLRKAL